MVFKIFLKYSRATISAIPLIWIFLFFFLVLRAYIYLGRMPFYNMPDPKSLHFDIHYTIVFFGILLVLLSIATYPIVFILELIIYKQLNKINFFVYLIGSISFILLTKFDPLNLNEWLLD